MFDSYLKVCPLPKWPNKDLSETRWEEEKGEESRSAPQRVNEATGTRHNYGGPKDKPLRRANLHESESG